MPFLAVPRYVSSCRIHFKPPFISFFVRESRYRSRDADGENIQISEIDLVEMTRRQGRIGLTGYRETSQRADVFMSRYGRREPTWLFYNLLLITVHALHVFFLF